MVWRRGQAYGQDLRDRVFLLADEGYGVVEIADTLRVSVSYVSKVLGRRRTTGETLPLPSSSCLTRGLTRGIGSSTNMSCASETRRAA
jgi:transposase